MQICIKADKILFEVFFILNALELNGLGLRGVKKITKLLRFSIVIYIIMKMKRFLGVIRGKLKRPACLVCV